MSVKLNNTLVTQQNDTFAYKAYLESLLGYPKDGLESYLWHKDKDNLFNTTDVTAGKPGAGNSSAVARHVLISGSKSCQMMGTPAHVRVHTDRYLLGDININIRIDMNPEAFCLMSAAGIEILHIVSAEFHVRYVKISDSVRLRHIAIMTSGRSPSSALYPLNIG